MLKSQPIWSLNKYKQCIEDDIIYEAPKKLRKDETINIVAQEVKRSFQANCLEVSTMAPDILGRSLAYENLYVDSYPYLSTLRAGYVGTKSGPNPEYRSLDIEDAWQMLYTFPEQILRFWFSDNEITYTFKDLITYADFLYFRSILQSKEITKNLPYILNQYKYFTDVNHIKGSTQLTPARAICFIKYVYESSYSTMVEELLHNDTLFTKVHTVCFRKEALH